MVADVRCTIRYPGEELRTGLNVVDVSLSMRRAQTLLLLHYTIFSWPLCQYHIKGSEIQTCRQEIESDVVTILLRCSGDSQ
jgi:hypothetical protein